MSESDKNCQSCQNYHGKTYNGIKFCCAIHPYGNGDGSNCPDYQRDRSFNAKYVRNKKYHPLLWRGGIYLTAASALITAAKILGLTDVFGLNNETVVFWLRIFIVHYYAGVLVFFAIEILRLRLDITIIDLVIYLAPTILFFCSLKL